MNNDKIFTLFVLKKTIKSFLGICQPSSAHVHDLDIDFCYRSVKNYSFSLLNLLNEAFSVYVYYERRVSRAVWLFFVRMYGKIWFPKRIVDTKKKDSYLG